MRHRFPKGHKFSKGGTIGNKGGRPRKEFSELADDSRELFLRSLDARKASKFLSDIWTGKPVKEIRNPLWTPSKKCNEPLMVLIPANLSERMAALREHLDRALGKPPQALEHTGKDGATIDLNAAIRNERIKRGLDPDK